ncbi:GvpL/GvpF family gas vesicle protein [Wenjunlia tyrosinilytica]|uniref:Gas vesicle protein n=1 Tax=Wenjunlia tyrosinilytica TaxID=1544741 RepID=A0A917ZQW4_9ACTN|nr:GvpL/GvpF family gas vesicle protein [Wenjunlia tyrosinilytica]GGO90240.1 gas vesicle protein [Wenjunlia tyrosinilytica]
MTGRGIYIYGFVRAAHRLPADSVGVGAPACVPRILRQGSVAAVVSGAPADLRARRRDLLAHQNLLLGLSDAGPLLPMRFGTVASDEDAVRRELAVREAGLLETLDRLAGMIEANLKAMPSGDGLARLVREDARIRRLRDDARRRPGYEADIRLGEAVARALSQRAAGQARRVLAELTPHAVATCPGADVPGCVMNVSFLVGREGYSSFVSVVNRFADRCGDLVDLRLTGPLPCYSFVAPEAHMARVDG